MQKEDKIQELKDKIKMFVLKTQYNEPALSAHGNEASWMFDFRNISVEYFYHLPFTWKNKLYKIFPMLFAIIPLRYTQTTELTEYKKLIRFSKEIQLLGYAEK